MLTIKLTPPHNFYLDIKLYSEIDPEYMIGRIDEKGNVIENEVEAEIDGKLAMIKLHDCFIKPYELLQALNFTIKLGKGIGSDELKAMLKKKYGHQIDRKELILIYLFEILEIE